MWAVGRGWWVKKKLVGRKILCVVKLVGEKWWVVGRALPFGPIPRLLIHNFLVNLKKCLSNPMYLE